MEFLNPLNDDTQASESSKKEKKAKPGSFQGLGLSGPIYKAVQAMGYNLPTPIQRKTIPHVLEGLDVVAMARTGSGKTAAFLVPLCENLKSHSQTVGIRAVVLSPTRELAMQTAKFCRQINRFNDLRLCLLVGGQAMEAQFDHLAMNPDIIIATPGRLMHHMLEAELKLSKVEMLVFDEADRLFELGFQEQLQQILEGTPGSRQCLLFSATLPSQLISFTRLGMHDPMFIRLDVDTTISENLALRFIYVRKDEKNAGALAVLKMLSGGGKKSTIMFVATRHHVEFWGALINEIGIKASTVYGNMDQEARESQVADFRRKKTCVLVTTDVAARGIDIPMLDNVLNFDFPPSAKLFVHRSGRTARAGRSGTAVSLVSLDDLPYCVELMLFLGRKLITPNMVEDMSTHQEATTPILGSLPALDHEVESLNKIMESHPTMNSLHKSMMASYGVYNKMRPSASKSSVKRSKEIMEACGGPARLQGLLHPGFNDVAVVQSSTSQLDFVSHLRGFRPKANKRGNVISDEMTKTMEQAKMDAVLPAQLLAQANHSDLGQVWGGSSSSGKASRGKKRPRSDSISIEKPTQRGGPRLSKHQRRAQKSGTPTLLVGKDKSDGKEFDGWEVQVDGVDIGGDSKDVASSSKPPAKPKQFYLSVDRDVSQEAKERGLDMEQYQVDLVPDDDKNIQKAKSVMRWNAKKKKFLPVMVSADGRVAKESRRDEAGNSVSGEATKTDLYKKWARTTKKRIQKVGEFEQEVAKPKGKRDRGDADNWGPDTDGYTGTMEFDDEGGLVKDEKKRKPVVPFYGNIEEKYLTHKQKRQLAQRKKAEQGIVTGKSKKELKTTQQMMLEKKKRLENKVKQNPKLRKAKAKEQKEKWKKKLEERASRNSQQSRSKMLIIEGEGPGQKKKKFDRRRNFLTGAI
jgi:ATP-dependent RNA helicase DDX54/DBP10